MIFERTFNFGLVRAIVTHESIYPYLTSDGAAPAEEFRLPTTESNWYVLVRSDARELLGMFWLCPYSPVCWEVHTCFLPQLRGADAIRAYRDGCAWLWQNSPCRKVVGNIPDYNRAALYVALRGGATVVGRLTASLLKDGRLIDQTIVAKGVNDG